MSDSEAGKGDNRRDDLKAFRDNYPVCKLCNFGIVHKEGICNNCYVNKKVRNSMRSKE